MRGRRSPIMFSALAAAVASGACLADDEPKPWIPTPSVALGDSLLSIAVDGYGAAYASGQPGGIRRDGITGALLIQPEIGHPFENGWVLGVRTSFLVHHDRLSGDNYGNDVIEKAYVYLE